MSTATTIEDHLAELAELRHRLDVEGHNEALAASVREAVESLPPDAPEVYRAFGAEVLRSVEAARGRRSRRPIVQAEPGKLPGPGEAATVIGPDGEEAQPGPRSLAAAASASTNALSQAYDREVQAIAGLGVRFPQRAPVVEEVPGHVTRLPEAHGLVHGGIVQARGFRLVVKAYRFFEHTKASTTLSRHVEVVAGVCDRFDDSGKLAATWSTAERLEPWYASTSAALPAPPCVPASGGLHGFYRPASLLARFLNKEPKLRPLEDDGLPDPLFYTGKVLRDGKRSTYSLTGFREAPFPATSLENALFTADARSSAGFVIDTPYVSVFSLGPGSPAVIVTLPRVFRDATIDSRGAVSQLQRSAGWEVRLFSA